MKKKDIYQLTFLGILLLCALVFTAINIQDRFFSDLDKASLEIRYIPEWSELDLQGHRAGQIKTPVQIIEFFDYECSFCKKVHPAIQSILEKYPQKVSVIYEHNPLSYHKEAYEAALAAECARLQGKFEPFHNALFLNQHKLGQISYNSLAVELNIASETMFRECFENKETAGIIQSGQELAYRLQVKGIPAFVINGKLVSGALSIDKFDELIQEELKVE